MGGPREPLDPARTTKLVLDQMRAVLDNPELSEDDHFFEWGGDSILAAQVMQCLNRETGLELATSLLAAFPTAAALSEAVAEETPRPEVIETSDPDRQASIEQWVIGACAQLGLPVAGRDDDFFDAGGTSLAVARIVARAEEEFGAEALSPEELIEQSTIHEIATVILRNTSTSTGPTSNGTERLATPR
jgi:acyl carrier protein